MSNVLMKVGSERRHIVSEIFLIYSFKNLVKKKMEIVFEYYFKKSMKNITW